MKLIGKLIRGHLAMFLVAVAFLTVEALADLLQPTLMSLIVDNGVASQDVGMILRYGGLMLGVALIGAAGAVGRNILASRTSQLIGQELRGRLYAKVQTFSFENIDRLQPASLITRITNDVTQIQNFINGCMRILVKAPITCVGAIALIIIQTPAQIPVLVVILVIAGALIAGNMVMGYPRFVNMQRRLDRLNTVSREFLDSIRVVKAFGAEQQEAARFGGAADELAEAGVSAMRVNALFSPLINLTVNFGIVLLLWRTGSGNAGEIGKVMASVNYMTQVLFSLGMVSNILNMAVRATASSARVKEIIDEQPAQLSPEHPLKPALEGGLRFESVTFKYAGSPRAALSDIDFELAPGEMLGIIGSTGSGKSTLVNLVPRFYDASEGRVLVDGVDVRDIDEHYLRDAIAVVPQKVLLFSGTIEENLRWGRRDASELELREAAKVACADEFVRGFAQGYQTVLGQGGVNLSGGQKQRLSIARALLKKPQILILDDCTSALDANTEASVLDGVRSAAEGMTVLLISQRISTVMRCDRVLCLEDGQMRGLGTHAELMRDCAVYRALYESQIGGVQDVG